MFSFKQNLNSRKTENDFEKRKAKKRMTFKKNYFLLDSVDFSLVNIKLHLPLSDRGAS